MNEGISVLGVVALLIILAADIFSVIGTGYLIHNKIRPQPMWIESLFKVWCMILALGILAVIYLLGWYLKIDDKDSAGLLVMYGFFLGLLPMMISGLIALFFKP